MHVALPVPPMLKTTLRARNPFAVLIFCLAWVFLPASAFADPRPHINSVREIPVELRCTRDSSGVATPRLPLAPVDAPTFATLGEVAIDDPASGRVPNYLRVLAATHPGTVRPFAHLFKTVIYGGTLAPETKAALGLAIARANGSEYLAAHLIRLLNRTESGKRLRNAVETGKELPANSKEGVALRYARDLTRAIHGVDAAQFAQARTLYNDSELVELTVSTCFFNYFARFCQGAGLSLEDWVRDAPNQPLPVTPGSELGMARVTLASDAELELATELVKPSPDLKKGLGIGIANSQRAMLRVPDLASAWWGYWKAVRAEAVVPRETLLQVSFAVSTLNGCRYCILHQVAGLRRQNVDIAKLQAMQKDDSQLSVPEKAAVTFARKLTASSQTFNDADFAGLKSAFPDNKAALDILLQTCAFNFMNRFTDGLRLPSEDEAVKVYEEVYGHGAYRAFPNAR